MVLDRRSNSVRHDLFARLGRYLPPKSLLVVNNSKVVPARLLGKKVRTGGEVEVFLLKDTGDGRTFEALLKPLKKVQEGEVMDFGHGLTAVLADKANRLVRFDCHNVLRHLHKSGHVPLPPYIKRQDTASDRRDYQTVYAKRLGSVASPTAGLHFTKPLIASLKAKGHAFKELTLHINYGTFKPVESADIRQHPMHTEAYQLPSSLHKSILKNRDSHHFPHFSALAAVGTTSCRVIESVAATGQLQGETNIFIYPGYEFKMTDILITNFHLPYSTLLMLVCAFGGYDLVMRAYREAIEKKYRFYSYGDAMMIL